MRQVLDSSRVQNDTYMLSEERGRIFLKTGEALFDALIDAARNETITKFFSGVRSVVSAVVMMSLAEANPQSI